MEKKPAKSLTTAALAFPPVGGARTLQPILFLHGLYPEGNLFSFAPAATSRESIVPSLLSVSASSNASTHRKGSVARH